MTFKVLIINRNKINFKPVAAKNCLKGFKKLYSIRI